MTSGCLDRKEVRGAIWGVHSTTDRPAGGNTERLFLAFGGPVCADRISNCPLDRVLTYKNLIYLLNLQFIKVPKSQAKWYTMHMIKPDGPHRPGRSVFSWRNTESKVNSQFPRITKASAYPSTGSPSRPISQESLCRWERAAREDSYIVNHAAGLIAALQSFKTRWPRTLLLCPPVCPKGKAPKDVSDALNDLRDLMVFHQKVSVAMGTSLQHLADSLFVHMSNMILLRRDSYLDFVKPGVKQDMMNILRNAPMFGYGLFPDAAIMTAEQDIQKFESTSVAQGPGPGAPQHTSWRGTRRFKPYDRRDR